MINVHAADLCALFSVGLPPTLNAANRRLTLVRVGTPTEDDKLKCEWRGIYERTPVNYILLRSRDECIDAVAAEIFGIIDRAADAAAAIPSLEVDADFTAAFYDSLHEGEREARKFLDSLSPMFPVLTTGMQLYAKLGDYVNERLREYSARRAQHVQTVLDRLGREIEEKRTEAAKLLERREQIATNGSCGNPIAY